MCSISCPLTSADEHHVLRVEVLLEVLIERSCKMVILMYQWLLFSPNTIMLTDRLWKGIPCISSLQQRIEARSLGQVRATALNVTDGWNTAPQSAFSTCL